jgi:predicted nucleic acid-binding Zn ribbon protein
MKRTEAQQIGEIIKNFIKQENLEGAMNEQKASFVWPEVVGYGINRYTISRSVKNGVMTVRLSSATLRNELMMSRSLLVQRINEAVGAPVLTDIIFK